MRWRRLAQRNRNDLIRAWAIARKDMRIYYFKPPVIMFGILTPVFLFLSFMVRRHMDASQLIPGLMAMTVFFGSSSVTSAIIPWERMQQTFDRLLMAPISLFAVLWGKTMAGIVFGLGVSLVPLIIGVLAFGMRVDQPELLLVTLILSACVFSSLGVLFASRPSQSPGDIMMVGNMVRLPLIFVSGIFIPLADLPRWGEAIAFLSPLTYCNDLMNRAIAGHTHIPTALDVAALIGFWIVFLLAGTRLHALSKRA